eukprot:3409258-Rhodomonas_salina.3
MRSAFTVSRPRALSLAVPLVAAFQGPSHHTHKRKVEKKREKDRKEQKRIPSTRPDRRASVWEQRQRRGRTATAPAATIAQTLHSTGEKPQRQK